MTDPAPAVRAAAVRRAGRVRSRALPRHAVQPRPRSRSGPCARRRRRRSADCRVETAAPLLEPMAARPGSARAPGRARRRSPTLKSPGAGAIALDKLKRRRPGRARARRPRAHRRAEARRRRWKRCRQAARVRRARRDVRRTRGGARGAGGVRAPRRRSRRSTTALADNDWAVRVQAARAAARSSTRRATIDGDDPAGADALRPRASTGRRDVIAPQVSTAALHRHRQGHDPGGAGGARRAADGAHDHRAGAVGLLRRRRHPSRRARTSSCRTAIRAATGRAGPASRFATSSTSVPTCAAPSAWRSTGPTPAAASSSSRTRRSRISTRSYTVFGQVVAGMDVVDKLRAGRRDSAGARVGRRHRDDATPTIDQAIKKGRVRRSPSVLRSRRNA